MIPIKIKKLISEDQFYRQCCLTGRTDERIEMHHTYIYAGKQIQELWAIVPVTMSLHSPYGNIESIHRSGIKNRHRARKEALKRAMKMYGSLELIQRAYPKKDWQKEFNFIFNLAL